MNHNNLKNTIPRAEPPNVTHKQQKCQLETKTVFQITNEKQTEKEYEKMRHHENIFLNFTSPAFTCRRVKTHTNNKHQ